MRGITAALIFCLSLNAFMFWGQTASSSINPGGEVIFEYNGSHISEYDSGNGTYVLNYDPTGTISSLTPESTGQTTGNVFTDSWNAITNWFQNVTGIKYVKAIVNTVPNFLKDAGLPTEFAFGLGYMWYVFNAFILVSFIRGLDA